MLNVIVREDRGVKENSKMYMKGIVVEKPNKVVIKHDIPMCKITGYEVLCKNIAGAICTGTDLAIISGKSGQIKYPTILGHESIGVVVAVGSKVANIKVGDLVTSPRMLQVNGISYYSSWGGFCEYGMAVDYKKLQEDGDDKKIEMHYCNQVVPKGIGIREAVMSITWSETLAYLYKIKMDSSSKVLLIGSGSVALSFATLLFTMKIEFSIVGSKLYQEKFCTLGKIDYVDYSDPYQIENYKQSKNGYFDYIIDAVGAKETVEYLCKTLKENGKLCIYGKRCGDLYRIQNEDINHHIQVYDGSYSVRDSYPVVFQMIKNKQLSADPWLEQTYPMEHILESVKELQTRKVMKVLIWISEEDITNQ